MSAAICCPAVLVDELCPSSDRVPPPPEGASIAARFWNVPGGKPGIGDICECAGPLPPTIAARRKRPRNLRMVVPINVEQLA